MWRSSQRSAISSRLMARPPLRVSPSAFPAVLLPANFQFDTTARYVDTLPHPGVPGYFTFDLRLAWTCRRFEFSVVGQNLWDGQHAEFGAAAARQEIPRSIYGKVTCRF